MAAHEDLLHAVYMGCRGKDCSSTASPWNAGNFCSMPRAPPAFLLIWPWECGAVPHILWLLSSSSCCAAVFFFPFLNLLSQRENRQHSWLSSGSSGTGWSRLLIDMGQLLTLLTKAISAAVCCPKFGLLSQILPQWHSPVWFMSALPVVHHCRWLPGCMTPSLNHYIAEYWPFQQSLRPVGWLSPMQTNSTRLLILFLPVPKPFFF